MGDYVRQTVVQLKQLLSERGLPTDGLKHALIARLEENDENAKKQAPAATEPEKVEAVPAAVEPEQVAPVVQEPPAVAQETAVEVAVPSGPTTTVSEAAKKETPQQMPPPEQIKKMALDLLNKKLYRAEKFGADETQAAELKRLINRVEKFGLDKQNPLMVELGLVKPKPKPKPKPAQQGKVAKKGGKNRANSKRR
ncbi:Tho1p KNAG_0L01520 [Huiozyma naganishii CBS 8797]|uniref:SAP domain-containing protein n=1 Tax=Huiozyma naganishii (strain ATCC MYA-139 / BCRC 22969 / CBS 8797 / KCTC 17520 / NBRC 10181 / NCYC 3082 / Yp74L-3) TaxID=1071383 RepID=J7S3R2_HUIN7|nr:hypothetical protein KNAG_0L01520 [Kazachstania naganishii CBS 8797]CCK72772.1 hypothetical protein KNAG_0L01520 [Kazachstania naganishii CBS 8797]